MGINLRRRSLPLHLGRDIFTAQRFPTSPAMEDVLSGKDAVLEFVIGLMN